MACVFYTHQPMERARYFVLTLLLWLATGLLITTALRWGWGHHDFFPLSLFISLAFWAVATGFTVLLSIRRLTDLHWPVLYSLFLLFPGFNVALWMMLSAVNRHEA